VTLSSGWFFLIGGVTGAIRVAIAKRFFQSDFANSEFIITDEQRKTPVNITPMQRWLIVLACIGNASTRYLFPSILVRGKFAHMTRLARTVVSGLPHHVTQRGSVRWCCIHQLSSHDFAGSPATPSKITSEKPT
jgi:hypothetical protein